MARRKKDTGNKGHNSISHKEMLEIIERVEKLISARQDINQDIKDILDKADSDGYDKKVLREIIKIRAEDNDEFRERNDIRTAYLEVLGLA